MTQKPSIAVIGSGYWGKNLVRNFHQLGVLELICDSNSETLESFKEQYPAVSSCTAYSDVIRNDKIKGVAIAAPAEAHFYLAREAILAGKHVYVEKPLVLDEEEGELLISLAAEKEVTLMVGHLLQYHSAFIRLKELVASGELGRINYIYSNRLNLGKIRREENVLWSFAPHDISMVLSLVGEMPESVSATGGYYLHKTIADVTTTHLDFPSGVKAHLFVSWLHPFKEQKLVVVGEKKMAVFDDTKPWEEKLLLYPHEIHWDLNVPFPIKAEPEQVGVVASEPLKAECQHFLDCISNKEQPITDGKEGLDVLKVLIASQKSLEDKGTRIDLKEVMAPEKQGNNGYFVHPSSVIDDHCEIGTGSKIWHFSHILSNSVLGKNCNIGQNVVVGPDATMGDNCKIQNNVSVYKGVTLEDEVFCGPSMVFTNVYNPRAGLKKMDQVRKTLVKKGATLGANSTIVCGITIGQFAFIGAGAVVNRDVPDHALMVGNPAKQIGWVCECGERLTENYKCPECSKQYQKDAVGISCED